MRKKVLYLILLYGVVRIESVSIDTNIQLDALPFPYNSIKVLLPFTAGGHFGPRQERGLQHVITTYKPTLVVEIGSYLGASTRYIAELLPKNGSVYAVDHWRGNVDWEIQPDFTEKQKLYYLQFLSNVIHAGLCHKIIPMKMESLEAAKIIDFIPDLVFIDGSHDYESVYNDITAWYKNTQGHGVLCGDDYNWGAKSVKKAVDRFAQEHNLTVKLIDDWFWYYEKE